jgi:uncharacterized protein YecE (DUF72 family)
MSGRIWIGTSGFTYPHWRGVLYPEGVPQRRWLEVYSGTFSAVEVNATFYRLPAESTVEGWFDRTPPDFTFAVKGSRFITHVRRLRDVDSAVDLFFSRVSVLGEKLGPVLFQLPPQLKADLGLLAAFAALLPPGRRCALEFRHQSWFTEEVYGILRGRDLALCVHDHHGTACPAVLTAGWAYLRLHGPGGRYAGMYGPEGLEGWAGKLSDWVDQGIDAYVFFNNDAGGNAVRDAVRLKAMVGGASRRRAGLPIHGPDP